MSGLIAIGLMVVAVIAIAVYLLWVKNPYLLAFGIILVIAGAIVLLYASGVIAVSGNTITFDWSAWNTAPVTPAETPAE